MRIIKSDRLDIMSWCFEPEPGAIAQARNVASLPFAVHHVALLPDTHQGYGMPIGCVLATENEIVVNAVGVDIGCGVLQGKVTVTNPICRAELKAILGTVREKIPLGFNKHDHPPMTGRMPYLPSRGLPIVNRELANAGKSLGTLGGGNHFIEIQKMSCGIETDYNIMIHSGSRNLGKKVCDYYNAVARENDPWSPPSWDLSFLPADSNLGRDYLEEMDYCVRFARTNRMEIMVQVFQAFREVLGDKLEYSPLVGPDCIHNYVVREPHFGKLLWIHRKGAVSATNGQTVLIPGSQGTASYRGTGLGNPYSFRSCSHGAGRKMSRGEARRTLNLAEEQFRLGSQGIIHGLRTEKDLDEAASAYKNIDEVMQQQADLVEIQARFMPIAVIKG